MSILPIKKLLYEISTNIPLPLKERFPTSTLRGAFGYSLLQLIAREEALSQEDKVRICKQLFFANDISDKGDNKDSARPFVLRGGFTRPDGKSFILEMIIFGKIAESETLIDNIVSNMCRMGLGNQNIPCDCLKLGSEDVIPEIPDLSAGRCVVRFQTPTRIKVNGKYIRHEIPFQTLFARLSERLKELVNVYTDNHFSLALSELKRHSSSIESTLVEGYFEDISRVSSRTGDLCYLSGFVGEMVYTGDLRSYADFLAFLPWVNVGSSAAFGCGWCTLEYEKLV